MKTIKVAFLDGNLDDTFGYTHYLLKKLEKYYSIELSDNPDYLFYREGDFRHFKYDSAIKIFYTGENISPDFNACDYAISFDYQTFQDRHFRLPLYIAASFYSKEELTLAGENYLTNKQLFTKEDLLKKTEFCSFVYSNYRGSEARKTFFEKLSNYKKVNAAGAYLNNTDGTKVKNKLTYEAKHKFSIAFENSSRSGYTTEKLVGALIAKTIPIYWGNPDIGKEFNTKRFINCHDYNSFEGVVSKIKEIDTNDELYLKMQNEPLLAEGYNPKELESGLDNFLQHIIEQEKGKGRRRTINEVKALEQVKEGLRTMRFNFIERKVVKLGSLLYKPFKKIKFFEKLKYLFFKN